MTNLEKRMGNETAQETRPEAMVESAPKKWWKTKTALPDLPPNSTQSPEVEQAMRQKDADMHDTAFFRERTDTPLCDFQPGDKISFSYVRLDQTIWKVQATVERCYFFLESIHKAARWHLEVKVGMWYDRKPYRGNGETALVPAIACKKI